jgi:Galactose oxidase-like, Early set domain
LDAETITEICLIRPTVTTHCVNTEQRYVGLEFSNSVPKTLQTSIPANRNLAPPGYYMLFIVTKDRVPSVAQFVHLS